MEIGGDGKGVEFNFGDTKQGSIKLGIMFVFYVIFECFCIRGWGLLIFVLVVIGVIFLGYECLFGIFFY